jgi:hypothetical protein
MNTVTRELANKGATLEAEYLSQTNSVTLAYAQTLGFHEINVKFAGDTNTTSNTDTIAKISMAR